MGSALSPMETRLKLSVIIPTLNESAALTATLAPLQAHRDKVEIIVVDGGSTDGTQAIASRFADHVINSEPGRARQMNAGAELATGKAMLFLHADTILPANFYESVSDALSGSVSLWGRFDISFDSPSRRMKTIAWWMNRRSRLTRVCTGDQAIFVRSNIFRDFGRYSDIPLMEDIELSKRLRYLTPPACIDTPVVSSSRRWREKGTLRTVLLMWRLRLLYWIGVSPDRLVRTYYPNH